MNPKFSIGDAVSYTWQHKTITCEVIKVASEPGEELSVEGNITYKVHDANDKNKHAGEPLYKLKIIDQNSPSKNKEVLHYESSLTKK